VLLTIAISKSLHMKDFKELEFVHELVKWIGPSLVKSLNVFCLFNVDINEFEIIKFLSVFVSDSLNKGVSNSGSRVVLKNTIIK
jgi:hypothetical protein